MLKRNSIFIRVLVPVVAVMLLQILLINLVLNANGTLRALDDSAKESLQKNAENRGNGLESLMVNSLSNLDKLQNGVLETLEDYLARQGITAAQALASRDHLNGILNNLSVPLLSELRSNSSTGVYVYFFDDYAPGMLAKQQHRYAGLYYRDPDPISTPANYSDILFVRGSVDIARKDKIQLDSFWKEDFTFSEDDTSSWADCRALLDAVLSNPAIEREELYYWDTPHLINDTSSDMNECITYTRLLFYGGVPIGAIGVELQTEQLKKYFPATDFDSADQSGYLLLTYDTQPSPLDRQYRIHTITGSYVRRLLGSHTELSLTPADRAGLFTADSENLEPMHVALQPLKLYNESSPFHGQQWALASAQTNTMLFAASVNLKFGLLYSFAIALFIGGILLSLSIRFATRPLIQIVDQIQASGLDDPIAVPLSGTYETDLLCDTINTMKAKRRNAEAALREERERYLIALENVADTFMEYDAAQDSFMLYYFQVVNQKPELHSHITQGFSALLSEGALCHPDDIGRMTRFFAGDTAAPIDLRIQRSLFSHIRDTTPDGSFYWFSFKASCIQDEAGGVGKIIGIARDITEMKLREQALIESSHRDMTTGLYNLDYGLQLIRAAIINAAAVQAPFALCAVHAEHFDLFEARYGRVFSGVLLTHVCEALQSVLSPGDIALRASNDDFLIFLAKTGKEPLCRVMERLHQKIETLYMGESSELRLALNTGVALDSDGDDPDTLIGRALSAMRTISPKDAGSVVYAADRPEDDRTALAVLREKPVSISLEINQDTMGSITFDLFERTADIPSVINILIRLLGKIFSLRQILICTYDTDFHTNQIAYQWGLAHVPAYRGGIDQVAPEDFALFERMLNGSGTILYSAREARGFSAGIRQLLYIREDEKAGVFGCALYENGVYAGMALFKSLADDGVWADQTLRTLYEITKTVAAHISIQKSNSASKAKSEFLSRMSHEIRTPMNAIIGMTDIAQANLHDPARLTECLRTIDFSSKHLLTLINDILDMARIESGKLKIENAPFSLASFLETLERLMRLPMENKGVRFVIQTDVTHTLVTGDEYRLRQVMVNLLGNACKFTEAGGCVTLSLREYEDEDGGGLYRFSVRDTGIGIGKEDQPRLFLAFEQASAPKKTPRQQGTGLGLAISNSIIAAMGGKIELQSELGKGSEFFFTLRFEQSSKPVESAGGGKDNGMLSDRLKGKRALLVEDNDINAEIATYILEEADMIIEAAVNGQEAVDLFMASPPGYYDIILMDIQMPVMDGLTATRHIRKNTKKPDARTVPIIAMTANAFDEDMKKSIESGMNGHLTKPIERDKLYQKLAELFS